MVFIVPNFGDTHSKRREKQRSSKVRHTSGRRAPRVRRLDYQGRTYFRAACSKSQTTRLSRSDILPGGVLQESDA